MPPHALLPKKSKGPHDGNYVIATRPNPFLNVNNCVFISDTLYPPPSMTCSLILQVTNSPSNTIKKLKEESKDSKISL